MWCICYRLIKEITYREWHRRQGNRADAPDLTEEEITGGEKNVCLMRWTKGAVEVVHKGTKAYMTGLMEDANLLAIHAHHYSV